MSLQPRPAREPPKLLTPHPAPEFLEPLQPVLGLVASDQACIDGADRRSDDPIRLDASLMQGLIDARLKGAERTAALEDEDDLALLMRWLLRARNLLFCARDQPCVHGVQHLVHLFLPHRATSQLAALHRYSSGANLFPGSPEYA